MRRVMLAEMASFDEPSLSYWKHVIQYIAQAIGSTNTRATAQKQTKSPGYTGVDPIVV